MASNAFFERGNDQFLHATQFALSLWAEGALNGPAVCGIAAHYAEEQYSEPGFRPARFTIDLFKGARTLPTATRGRLIRSGRRIRVAEVDVIQYPTGDANDPANNAVVVARSTTVFLRTSTNPPGERWTRPADGATFVPPQVDDDDVFPRYSSDDPATAGADGIGPWASSMQGQQNRYRKRLWSQAAPAVADEPLTPFVRAVISAEATSLVCNWGSTGIGFINCDLTVALARLPVGPRIGVEADSHVEKDGISVSTSGLYDTDGVFGSGIVTAVNNAAAEIDFTTVDTVGRYAEP